MQPYNQTVDEIIKHYATDSARGLSSSVIVGRRARYGANELLSHEAPSWVLIFIRQFYNPLIYILLGAALIIFFTAPDKLDAFIISAVLLFNAIIGTIQEGRTQSLLAALSTFVRSSSLVLRDGKPTLVDDHELVVGDVLLLREGQKIAADARVVQATNLCIDEALLTGESAAVEKNSMSIVGPAHVFDQKNMIFRGTYVIAGHGTAIIVATGAATEIGKIQRAVVDYEVATPLRQELDRLSWFILLAIFGMCIALLLIGLGTGKSIQELLTVLTALFICVIPEGLPVVLTLVLARGAYHMAQQNVLVRRLQAVEGLGRTDVIILDKTGTLTHNEMMVTALWAQGELCTVSGRGYAAEGTVVCTDALSVPEHVYQLGIAATVLSNAEIIPLEQGHYRLVGDPTEAALAVLGKKLGCDKALISKEYVLRYERPFDPSLRYHAGFYEHKHELIAYVAGSPEVIFASCAHVPEAARIALAGMFEQGLRVVALAKKRSVKPQSMPSDDAVRAWSAQHIATGLELLGLCALQDAIRANMAPVIERARAAGIHIIMATGDHRKTAVYVAKKTGIFKKGDSVLEGTDLQKLSPDELARLVSRTTVYARVAPEQKLAIVRMLQARGALVAMTGDGINDAPSLVAADLGIAMGGIGTEVAKNAADMVLLDDSCESIMVAIEQGRHIFYTLRRVVLYFFATNMGEIFIVLFALLANFPLPITAAQILWLNLVTDGFLDIALSMEPREDNLLSAQWRYRSGKLIDGWLFMTMLCMALAMGIGSLGVFAWYAPGDLAHARTMTLLTMVMFQWFNAWSCRSTTQSIFQLGLFTNRWLVVAAIWVFLLQLALVYTPFMQAIFKTVPVTAMEFGCVVLLGSTVLLFEELRKAVVRWYRKQ